MAWCHHLMMLKKGIIANINAYIGEKIINDIRFQAGVLQHFQNNEQDNTHEKELISKAISKLTIAEEKNVRDITACLQDEKLQQKFLRIIKKDQLLKKNKASSGWKKCKTCQTLCSPEDDYCTACTLSRHLQVLSELRQLLIDAPWLRYTEANEYVKCTRDEFEQAKDDIARRLSTEIQLAGDNIEPLTVMTLVMLLTNLKPEAVNDNIVAKVLNKIRGRKHVSTPRF
jgi:hypothetical protein